MVEKSNLWNGYYLKEDVETKDYEIALCNGGEVDSLILKKYKFRNKNMEVWDEWFS